MLLQLKVVLSLILSLNYVRLQGILPLYYVKPMGVLSPNNMQLKGVLSLFSKVEECCV